MLSRRRCCTNAAVFIVLTILSALILLWSSAVSKYSAKKLPTLRSRQPEVLLANVNNTGDSGNLEVDLLSADSPISKYHSFTVGTVEAEVPLQSTKTQTSVENGVHKFSLSDKLLKRFPRVMIIGFGKAGTKALYEALKLHPQLTGPYKEKRFFSQHYSIGLENYLRSLPDPPENGFISEKSPDYIIVPESPQRIKSAALKTGVSAYKLKFIVVLRDPVDRAMSEYLEWNIQRQSMNKPRLPPFEEMVIARNGSVDASQPFINASCYAYHVRNWLKYFSKEQMCYVDGDRFVVDPLKEIQMLEECLQLEHYFSEKNFVYDERRGFFCFQDTNLVNSAVCMNKSKGRKHPDIPTHVVKLLRNYFQPWSSLMPGLISRNISWSN